MAFSRTRATKSLTTLKLTSASSSARRTSRIAASTSASLIRPRPVRVPSVARRRSLRVSNTARSGLPWLVMDRPRSRTAASWPGGARVLTHRGGRSVAQGPPETPPGRWSRAASDRATGYAAPLVRNPFASPLWQNHAFVRVWAAASISIFGSLITRIALPFVAILDLGAGPIEVAVLRSMMSRRCCRRPRRRRVGRSAAAAAGPDLGRPRAGRPARSIPVAFVLGGC